jgi:hypothetical protein
MYKSTYYWLGEKVHLVFGIAGTASEQFFDHAGPRGAQEAGCATRVLNFFERALTSARDFAKLTSDMPS